MTAEQRSDEDAIRELLDRQIMGWNAGDAEAYASVFTPDADYVTFLGSHHKGRAAIAASYAPLFQKFLKGSRLEFEITQLRFLTPDVALVHAKGAVAKGRADVAGVIPAPTSRSLCGPTADGYLPPRKTPHTADSPKS